MSPQGALMVAVLTVPAAVAVAVLKYRLYDLDIVARQDRGGRPGRRGLHGHLRARRGRGRRVTGRPGSSPLTFAAAALAAVLLQPVRVRAGLLADRLVYGKRATPYEVLSEFSGQMAGTYSVADVLPRLARDARRGTGAERAEVSMRTEGPNSWRRHGRPGPSPWHRPAGPPQHLTLSRSRPRPWCPRPDWPSRQRRSQDRAKNGRARVFEVEHQGERLGSLRVTSVARGNR